MNPKVKNGDSILIIDSRSSGAEIDGEIVTVIGDFPRSSSIIVKSSIGNRTVYSNTDVYVFANRDARIASAKKAIISIKSNLKKAESELEYLEKYESEEEAVADKLDQILTAHANSTDKDARLKAMTSVLKELKNSHIL